jgi:hypothetical protein
MYTIVPTAKLKFKGKIGRLGICSFSATIDIDRSISRISRDDGLTDLIEKRPSGGARGQTTISLQARLRAELSRRT